MRDEETLEEEEEKGGRRLLMCMCVVVVYLFQRGGWVGMDALAPIRARGQAEGGRSLFSLGACPLFAFSRVSFVYHFTGRRRKKGGTSGPLMSDSTRLQQRNKARRSKADMTGNEITPRNECGQRQSVLWMKPCLALLE